MDILTGEVSRGSQEPRGSKFLLPFLLLPAIQVEARKSLVDRNFFKILIIFIDIVEARKSLVDRYR